MNYNSLINLLIAIVKQARKDAQAGDIEALAFMAYLQGLEPIEGEQLNLFG